MEFATGALGTLLPKLGELLLDEYNLHKGLKMGIKDLMDELLVIQAALVRVSDVPLDQLDPLVKIWANDVRELSYAIEDSLDSFMVHVEGVEPTKPHTFLGYIKKTCKKVTKFKTRREIANDIKDIKIQVREVKERYDRYKDVIGNTNARTEVDPRIFALYNKASDLVGIDEAIEEVMKILSDHSDASNNKLKTISIVGPGGLGKTTLAKVVYDKLNNQFIYEATSQKEKKNIIYGAFVPVGQNPDMKKVLRDILHELDKQSSINITASKMDVRQLIDMVREFLKDKRYFIVIDDIWDIPTWEILKRALVDSNSGSRIITTTRIVEVAKKVGGVYNMKPLSDVDSECLFYTRTCGGEGVSSAHQPTEVTNKIIKKCGGVPLAIITIASLLVGKRSEDWSKVYDAIGFGHEENEVVHNTRKILSFSYYDLPSNLKTCLLYLSMFPEDRFIEKNSLIWRWVSEGFVPDREGIGSFELGETYFNELVNKSMIRWIKPAEDEETTGGCRVHDMVLDLIRTISKDVNFVTVHDREQHSTYSRGKRTNGVRRLAHHGRSVEHRSSIELEHVRSFNAISCSDSGMPLLFSFKVLRVLVIEDCGFWKGCSLEHLGKLVHLRYLGLVNTSVKLPEDIGHDLKFLEILDVRGRMIRQLPPSIGELRNLRCLWADGCTEMKGQIGKLTSLEELQLHSVDKCPSFWTEVGKLTKLRVLKIYFNEMDGAAAKALVESLCNLHKIQSLKVNHYNVSMKLAVLLADHGKIIHGDNADSPVFGGSLEQLAPSSKLRLLTLPRITIDRVPSWINSLCVPLLSHLWLHVEVVEEADIQSLGSLPSLYYLVLLSEEKNGIPYTIGSDGFHKLRRLVMKNIEISIGEGALPMLEILLYSASARRKDAASLVPRNNSWPFLKRVTCYLDCANSGNSEIEAVESALKRFTRYLDFADSGNMEVEAVESVLTDAALVFCGHAAKTHPGLVIVRENYDLKASLLIDELEWMLCGLNKSEGLYRTAYQEESIQDRITLLETLLRDDAKPRGLWYDEQEIHGFVTKFKSLVNDDSGTNQEQPDNGCDQASCCGDHREGAVYESHLQTDNVSDQASCHGDHQEGTSHLHWDNGSDYASSCCDYEEEASQH